MSPISHDQARETRRLGLLYIVKGSLETALPDTDKPINTSSFYYLKSGLYGLFGAPENQRCGFQLWTLILIGTNHPCVSYRDQLADQLNQFNKTATRASAEEWLRDATWDLYQTVCDDITEIEGSQIGAAL